MSKRIAVLLIVALCLAVLLCSCSTPGSNGDPGGAGESEPPAGETGEGESPVGEGEEPAETPAEMVRINVFETGIQGQTAEEVDDKEEKVMAYSIQDYVGKNFSAPPLDPVIMVASDGYMASIRAEEFVGHYITLEGEYAPLLAGPEVEKEQRVKYLRYIKTANESICFVEETLNVGEMFSTLDMLEAGSYKFVAADGFSFEVAAADIDDCTLYKDGTSVNGTLAGLSGGDMRDLLFIEAIQ